MASIITVTPSMVVNLYTPLDIHLFLCSPPALLTHIFTFGSLYIVGLSNETINVALYCQCCKSHAQSIIVIYEQTKILTKTSLLC